MVDTPSPSGIGATLTRKAGPLPIWAWTGLGVAVVAAFLIYRQRKAAAAAAAAAAATSTSGAPATNLGTNTLSNLVPQAYPMPFQTGDVFTNVTNQGDTSSTPNPPPSPTPTMKHLSYAWAKGDTWQSVGQKLNIAPILLWESAGSPGGFKTPAPGTLINLDSAVNTPNSAFADQAKIVAGQQKLAQSGWKPTPGKTYSDSVPL